MNINQTVREITSPWLMLRLRLATSERRAVAAKGTAHEFELHDMPDLFRRAMMAIRAKQSHNAEPLIRF